MLRKLSFIYGFISYLMFLAVYLYLAGFLVNIGAPKSIDSGEPSSTLLALTINVSLLLLFGVQHSVMARPNFKRWWTKYVPHTIERSTYVLISNLLLILLFWQWRPLSQIIWKVENDFTTAIIYAAYVSGVLIVPVTTFFINHFDLFGLRQVWLNLKKRKYRRLPFMVPGPYKLVRHPLYVGWLLMFWSTPTMTIGHFIFAAVLTGYILVAIRYEERDLVHEFGDTYERYRERTPMLIPNIGTARSSESESPATA